MKRLVYFLFLPLLIAGMVTSCSKGGSPAPDDGVGVHVDTPSDTTAPVLDIYTPAAAQTFANGTSINITGKLTDDYGLYRGSIRITNDANGSLVKEQLYEIHGLKTYNFNISHTVFTLAAADYTITVSFEDHGTNVTARSVKVRVNL